MVYVLPLPILVFQLLSLCVGVAIESLILRYNLGLSRKRSVEYAILVNLYSSIVIWLLFFLSAAMVPEQIKLQMMSYVLFNRFYTASRTANSTLEAVTMALVFLIICLIEFKGFDVLEFLLKVKPATTEAGSPLALVKQFNQILTRIGARGQSSFFILGAITNSVILLIFLLRAVERYADVL